jgi:hypothetical protein
MSTAGFLQIEAGPESGRRIPLLSEDLTIGRQAGNDLTLNDQQVSRRHARIESRDGEVFVTDLGTANGTYVNGQRIDGTVALRSGDAIGIGETTIRFVADMTATVVATAAPEPPPRPSTPIYQPPPQPAPPTAGRPNRLPLIIGGVIIAFLLLCICIGFGLLLLSRAGGSNSSQVGPGDTAALSIPSAISPLPQPGTDPK